MTHRNAAGRADRRTFLKAVGATAAAPWMAAPAKARGSSPAGFGGAGFAAVQCEGRYPRHLQGICTDGRSAIFWSFTVDLVKTDLEGRVLKRIAVDNHHGDLCFRDGKVYVAVNLGRFNRPAGEADSWVYIYDADSLDELARHETPQVVHGAGGMAYESGRFIVIGGLPEGVDENYLYEYDEDLVFRKRYVLESGYTRLGIQTATYGGGGWWFGCYGSPPVLLKTDEEFQLVGKYDFACALGIEAIPDDRFLVARGRCDGDAGCIGWALLAVADDESGLRTINKTD